jgi:hypothetical protein
MAAESVEIVLNGVDNATPVMDKVTQKLVDNENKYISKLKEQLIALEQGAEAAERFKLSEMGFAEETINSAMALKQQIEAAKEAASAAEELAKQTEKAAQAQQEMQSGPGFGESATEFANSLGDGLNRARGIAEAAKPIVEYITGSAGWQMKMNRLMEQHQQQVDFNLKKQKEQLDVQIQIANLQSDRVIREEMLKAAQAEIVVKLEAQQKLVEEMRKTQEEAANSFGGRVNALAESVTGGLYNNNEDQQIVENILTEEEKRLKALQEQKNQLDQQLEVENEQVKAARQKLELEQQRQAASKTAEEELNRMRAEIREMNNPGENERRRVEEMFNADGVTEAQRMELENLRATRAEAEERFRIEQEGRDEMRASIEETRNAEAAAYAELKKSIEDTQKAMEDQAKRDEDYLNNLRQRNIELTQGTQAAQEFAAAQRGISEEAIEQGRAISEQNKELEEKAKKEAELQKQANKPAVDKQISATAPLQAMQSRLLSRVSTGGGDRVAKATEKTAELTAEIERLQREQLDLQKRRGVTELAIVEG